MDAQLRGLAKSNDEGDFVIANELIAARIGRALGLPVPEGVVAEDTEKKLYYFSLDVSREQKGLPPIYPDAFVRDHPWIAAGVAMFDVFIANPDRHRRNLSQDRGFVPERVSVFDHGASLLGESPPEGQSRLELSAGELGCWEGNAKLAATSSCLLDQQLDGGHLGAWIDRIQALPGYVIDDACDAVVGTSGLNVDRATANGLAEWLRDRQHGLSAIVGKHEHVFAGVARWPLLPEA